MGVQAPASPRPNVAWRPLYSVLGDERLARLVTDGSEQAFAPLYERYHQQLYRYCRSIVHDDTDAQDSLQSTFASAFAALRRGRRDAPLRPWLFRIAHNEAVSVIRRRRPEQELSEASQHSTESVEDQADERARFALLLRDLSELPERQRSALVMRELSGLSHEEIAIVLATSVGAAKQTIFEARRSLSEFAEGRVMECEEVRRMISDADGRTLRSRRVRAHLNDCCACSEFAAAISTRSADLRALTPMLPAGAAATALARALGMGSGHGAGNAAGLAAGTAGKTAGAALAAKAVAGVVIVAATTVGATAELKQITNTRHYVPAARAAAPARAEAAVQVSTRPVAGGHPRVPDAHRNSERHGGGADAQRGSRRGSAPHLPSVTRLAGVGTAPVTSGGGSKGTTPAPATAGAPAGSTAPQQSPPSTGSSQKPAAGAQGSSGTPTSHGSGSGPPLLGTGSGAPAVSVPGASASVPNGSASVSVPGASATVSVPGGSATVSVPGASATVSIPGGSSVSVGGSPPLRLPGLGSVLGVLGGHTVQQGH
jgi:RNA polymerase sigma factor (sigma-70 family)